LGSLETLREVTRPDASDLAAVGAPGPGTEAVEVPVVAPVDPCDPIGTVPLAGVEAWAHGYSAEIEVPGELTYGVQVWRFDGPDGPRDTLAALGTAAQAPACSSRVVDGIEVVPVVLPEVGPGRLVSGWDLTVPGRTTSRRTAYVVVENSLVQVTLRYRAAGSEGGGVVVPEGAAAQLAARLAGRVTPVERALVERAQEEQDA